MSSLENPSENPPTQIALSHCEFSSCLEKKKCELALFYTALAEFAANTEIDAQITDTPSDEFEMKYTVATNIHASLAKCGFQKILNDQA